MSDLRKMVGLHVQSELMTFLQNKETFRSVVAEALGTKVEESTEKPVEDFGELSNLFAMAGGQVHA